MTRKLTNKQQLFINEYLQCWNATEAARRAGYAGNDVTLAAVGYENLRKPQISSEVSRRLEEQTMSADEALLRLSKQARSSFGDIVKLAGSLPLIDWEKAVETGVIDNIKEISFKEGSVTVKLHDSQSALVHILKQLQLLEGKPTDRHEVTVNDSRERLERAISDRVERGRSYSGTDLAQ